MNRIKIFAVVVSAISLLWADESQFQITPTMEIGFLSTLSHTIQFGEDGTQIDYREDGGQDNLYAITRFSVDMQLNENHKVTFLYQPLSISTENMLERDITVDSMTFTEGTPVKFTYSFPFYRASWLYDFKEEADKEIAIGISFQIRNASITFQSLDGEQIRTNRNVGPVPILKFRHRLPINDRIWWGSEIDGFYAPVSYLNGSDNEVVGAILDASLRAGVQLSDRGNSFLNLRYLGGGAVGTSEDDLNPGSDGYVDNWLHFLTVSLGFSWDLM